MLAYNYIKIALRNIFRYKIFSLINILGLSIGFAVSILILSYVLNELEYDSFHENADNIYRIPIKGEISGHKLDIAVNCAPIAPSLVKDNPNIINYVRILKTHQQIFFNNNSVKYYENNLIFADSTFFDIFSFNLIKGDKNKALKNPHSLVITEEIAKKYFGDKNPIGKQLKLNNEYNYTITGIIKNNNRKSHIPIDFLASFSTLEENDEIQYGLDSWTSFNYYTYIKTSQNANIDSINIYLKNYLDRKLKINLKEEGVELIPYLQAIKKIHLHSKLMNEIEDNGSMEEIYIYSIIALIILLIACINFINLTTAHSSNRLKEVSIRKILGANRGMLIHQFIGEAVVLSIIAYTLSLFFIELLLPVFNNVVDKDLNLIFISKPYFLLLFLLFAIIVGIISGSYPSFFISSFSPVKILKRKIFKFSSKSRFRNILVVFQFIISITLIISTSVVYTQLNFIKNEPLGFSKNNVLIIPILDKPMSENIDSIKKAIDKLPGVINIASSSNIPGKEYSGIGFTPEGMSKDKTVLIYNFKADENYLSTMDIKLIQGRNFNSQADSNCVIINETLCKQLNWKEPIGKKLFYDISNNKSLTVIGVIKDYHYRSLKTKISPLLISLCKNNTAYLSIKINPNYNATINNIKLTWQNIDNRYPFNFFMLHDSYDNLYILEKRLGKLFISLTILALLLASLGLYGLASFSTKQRTKEIGIRRVHGATVFQIVMMLSKDLSKWVLIASFMAWPISYLLITQWLNHFQYKIELSIWTFIISTLIGLLIAIITANFQAIKSALANPVESLRYE